MCARYEIQILEGEQLIWIRDRLAKPALPYTLELMISPIKGDGHRTVWTNLHIYAEVCVPFYIEEHGRFLVEAKS